MGCLCQKRIRCGWSGLVKQIIESTDLNGRFRARICRPSDRLTTYDAGIGWLSRGDAWMLRSIVALDQRIRSSMASTTICDPTAMSSMSLATRMNL